MTLAALPPVAAAAARRNVCVGLDAVCVDWWKLPPR